jgi:electron transfer flavoprotein beta subunit
MQILVCLKQVPEKDSRFKIDASGVSILEEDLIFETNESDQYALEEALRLKEKLGGEVVVLSLGRVRVVKALKNALAMGADRGIHLNDPEFSGSDAFGIARALSRVIQKEHFDVVFTGVQSDDLSFGQTGTLLAHFLGWSHATIVIEAEIVGEGRPARIRRELESNLFEEVEIPLPAVLTIQSGMNQPRYATLKGIMQAKKKEIREYTCADLELGPEEVGEAGSRVQHLKLSFPEKKKKTMLLTGSPEEIARVLVEQLRKVAKVL